MQLQKVFWQCKFILEVKINYCHRIAGMFGGVNVWRIAKLKVIGKKSLANG